MKNGIKNTKIKIGNTGQIINAIVFKSMRIDTQLLLAALLKEI